MKNNNPKPEQGVRKVIEHRSRDFCIFLNTVSILRCLVLVLYIPDIVVYGAFAICFLKSW